MTGMTMSAELASYLKRRLHEEGWSRQQAADQCGLSKTTITNLINSPNQTPDMRTIEALAKGFKESVTRLIEYAGLPSEPMPSSKLTSEEEAMISRLTPAQRDALLAVARQMLRDDR
jgi:transcriptional regulator with XRE-family HTH domain